MSPSALGFARRLGALVSLTVAACTPTLPLLSPTGDGGAGDDAGDVVVAPSDAAVGGDVSAMGSDVPVVGSDVPVVGSDVPVVGSDVPVPPRDVPVVGSDVVVLPRDVPAMTVDVPVAAVDVPVVTSDVPVVAVDVPVVTSDVPVVTSDVPAGCSLVGLYSFRSPIAITMYLRMRGNGTWAYATNASSLDASTLSGTYMMSGDVVSIRETGTSLEGCRSTDVGAYRVSFDAACNTAVLRAVSDPCSLRAALMSGRSFTRIAP